MNQDTTKALIAAFNALGSLYWADADFVLGDVGNTDDEGVTLYLARDIPIGCGDHETETYAVRFTWDELIADRPNNSLGALAVERWEQVQTDAYNEKVRHEREKREKEAAEKKRQRAASKGARTKRELATLARLKAKYENKP